MSIDINDLAKIINEAKNAAYKEADKFFETELNGFDHYACGFAWVEIMEYRGQKIKGNTKMGRALKSLGITNDYTKVFQIWNPSGYPCQNVDTLYVGAKAAADVLTYYGFIAYANYRLD